MTLTEALAAGLENHRPIGLSEIQIAHDRGRCGVECAAAILRDPAFREALTDALAEAIHERFCDFGFETCREDAEAFIAHLLPEVKS